MNAARQFARSYAGCRVQSYVALPPMWGEAAQFEAPADATSSVLLDVEIERRDWRAISPDLPDSWRAGDWDGRPVRWVDGTDKGDTVAWFQSPGGYPVPLRFSQLGAVALQLCGGEKRRTFEWHEPVLAMIGDAFPWHEVEELAADLGAHGMRLLLAKPPGGALSYDFETMRKAAQYRSNDEMGIYEEAAIAHDCALPTIVDGPLENRSGGFDSALSPVVGVIKTHRETYLHPLGLQRLYTLEAGQRTPIFHIRKTSAPGANGASGANGGAPIERRLPVASWYLRLTGGAGALPSWGYVRVEVALAWLQAHHPGINAQTAFADRLSRALFLDRCTDSNYGRSAVSLDTIVRAEEHMKALLMPQTVLLNRFYDLTGL